MVENGYFDAQLGRVNGKHGLEPGRSQPPRQPRQDALALVASHVRPRPALRHAGAHWERARRPDRGATEAQLQRVLARRARVVGKVQSSVWCTAQ